MIMNDNSSNFRILIVDDHPAIRTGVSILLKSRNIDVAAEADSWTEALAILEQDQFDIVLLDLTLKDGSGLNLLPELESRNIYVLVYTMHESSDLIKKALDQGALGYVSKQEETDILFEAIDKVANGKRFLSPCAQRNLKINSGDQKPEETLSKREKQIFVYIGKGFGSTEIAEKLNLSRSTIETYCTRITHKLNLETRRELRKLAISSI
jgi:DNA-binding NarL/FixJ family response regulator